MFEAIPQVNELPFTEDDNELPTAKLNAPVAALILFTTWLLCAAVVR
jgi:hypothetical protein